MPLTYAWYLKGRIVLIEGTGVITAEDVLLENDIMAEYLAESKGALLHVICDQRYIEEMPDFRALNQSTWRKDPRVGWLVYYGVVNPFFNFMIATGTQLFKLRYKIVESQVDAANFLESVDNSIPRRRKTLVEHNQTS